MLGAWPTEVGAGSLFTNLGPAENVAARAGWQYRQEGGLAAREIAGSKGRPETVAELDPGQDSGPQSRLDPDQLDKQWVTRLNYDGPEGNFLMVLIFRLVDGTRFSIQAKDRIGRTWWDLAVEDGTALSLDRRGNTYCVYEGAVEIQAIPLGPLEFTVLPQLILGRLPFQAVAQYHRGDGRWSLQDERGRTWFARTDGNNLTSWTLLVAGKPSIWWSGEGNRWFLSAREQKLQLRWKNGPRRTLTQLPLNLEIPDGYRLDCSASRAFRGESRR